MKILIWSRWIDTFYSRKKDLKGAGGAELQMAFWAKCLADINDVYTFSWLPKVGFKKVWNVQFLWVPWVPKLGVVFDLLKYVYVIVVRPNRILVRFPIDVYRCIKLKRFINTKVIFLLASDEFVSKKYLDDHPKYKRAMQKLDGVLAQSRFQEQTYKKNVGNNPIYVQPNIFDPELFYESESNEKVYDFIWVGSIKELKRPDWFVEMAKRYPQYSFAMVGAIIDQEFNHLVNSSNADINNFSYLGFCSLQETVQHIRTAKILVNTSRFEGFPNTFLQAWNYGIPVLSSVNSNEAITKHNLGFFAQSLERLIKALPSLLDNRKEYSKAIEKYFMTHHSTQVGMGKISLLLRNSR